MDPIPLRSNSSNATLTLLADWPPFAASQLIYCPTSFGRKWKMEEPDIWL